MTSSPLNMEKYSVELERMRASLQAELEALQHESANVDQQDGYGVKNHPAEDASELFLRQRNLAVANDLQDELADVEQALERIAEGTYGVCQVCGEPINPERLDARPSATFCIRHQRDRERQEHDVA